MQCRMSRSLCKPKSAGAVRRARSRVSIVYASRKGERSGIHDPAGPTGSWGQGERVAHKEQAAQEESFNLQDAALVGQELRSEQRHRGHPPAGHVAGVDREKAVGKELGEMQEEKADAKSDEEYTHMGRLQKWFMEAKAALYAFLKTGWEPL